MGLSHTLTLVELGSLRHAAGDVGAAVRSWRQALTIFEELDAPEATDTRRRIDDARPNRDGHAD